MKVAYVTPFYTPEVDGRFGRFHDWVHAVRDADNPPFTAEVHALTATGSDDCLVERPSTLLGDGDDLWGASHNKLAHAIAARQVRRSLCRSDANLLHVLTFDTVAFPVARAVAAATDRPLVVGPDIAGWNPIRRGGVWDAGGVQWWKHRAGFAIQQACTAAGGFDGAVAFSRYHCRMLHYVGIGPESIHRLQPGVDPVFHPAAADAAPDATDSGAADDEPPIGGPDTPELLYVGDLSAHKGYPTFLSAVERLDRPVRARVVGTGEPAVDTPGAVVHEGFVPRGELPACYRGADLFVCPSIDEMAPNTVVEALACGTPVVVTDTPGVNADAPHGAARFIWPREPRALADGIESALGALPDLQERALAAARAGEFDADRPAAALASFYDEVSGGR
jgi:glycosyltransferase involved in cell wall biosynthesis